LFDFFLAFLKNLFSLGNTNGIVKSIGARSNENSIAKNLYKVLRAFDEEDVSFIYSEAFDEEGIGYAIMNRLGKQQAIK
jgi:L-threonylcarbamoyladenylate synthase